MTDNEFYSILNSCMPDYNVVENIGSGNYGCVYKCERDGIYYAIKIISVPANEKELQALLAKSDKEVVQAYLKSKIDGYRKEIMLMAELKGNRSIVNIEDYKVIESKSGIWYIVIRMELLTSLPLYASKNVLDEKEVIRLGIDICDALSICEKHNIIHRDIKPENIMRHSEGTYKLGDFGVAKQLSKTTAGTIAGTEGFMAPEVYKAQEYNQTADIYSLGIVLYYYLNNKKMPYVKPDDKSLISEQHAIVRRMTDPSPLPLPPYASQNLGQIVVKACMFDKECRYRSAADMRADLVKVLNGENITVNFVLPSERETIYLRNDKNGINSVYTPFTGDIVDNTSEIRAKSRNKSTEAFDESNKPKRKKKGLITAIAAVCVVAVGVGGFTVYQKFFAGPEPGIYLDENGNEYEVLSKEAMEEAYSLGVQYAEQGEYPEAIEEFNKVSEYSGKYDEAQKAIEKAKIDYQTALIDKAMEYMSNKDYEKAFSMIDTGVAALGVNAQFKEAKDTVLDALKVDYVARAEEQEKSENYDKALECINLVLTYIPDDYEVKGIQSRVDSANTAKKALEKAAEYKYNSEYAKLFSSLDNALNEVTDSTSATAKIKMAYDSYMDEYLELIETQTSDLETVSEYENAIKLLESAVEIFPNDYDLKTQLQNLQTIKDAITVINKANTYYAEKSYIKVFPILNEALDELHSNAIAREMVEDAYKDLRSRYVSEVFEIIGNPQTPSEYDDAISCVSDALEILPEDNELLNKLDELNTSKPIDMLSTNIASAMTFGGDSRYNYAEWEKADIYNTDSTSTDSLYKYVYIGDFKDNYKNNHKNALLLRTFLSYCWATYVIYDCENHDYVSGNVSVYDESKSYPGNLYVEIYGISNDMTEELLYRKAFVSGIKPQDIELNISDYSSIKLQIATYDKTGEEWACHRGFNDGNSGIIFSDFTLSK